MTTKQQRFVEEYLIDLNATQAAIRAGHSKRRASEIGYQLLQKTTVQQAIELAKKERSERTQITVDRVLEELAKIGFANMQDYMKVGQNGDPYVDLSKVTRDQAAAISEVTVEDFMDGRGEDAREVRRVRFKLSDKRAALVDIGKHLGMFVDRREISGPGGKPLEVVNMQAEIRRELLEMKKDERTT